MKKVSTNLFLIITALLIVFSVSCGKESKNRPTVTTAAVTNITQHTAVGGGSVTNDQGETVVQRGLCWSTSPNPSIASSKTVVGGNMWDFKCAITGLAANTKYYVRAYATLRNPDEVSGTGYGAVVSFTTLP